MDKDNSQKISRDVSRELNGEVFTEQKGAGGGQALGVLAVFTLSICTVILYARMYQDLVRHQDEILGRSKQSERFELVGVHSAKLEAKAAAEMNSHSVAFSDESRAGDVSPPADLDVGSRENEDRWRDVDLTFRQAVENVAGRERSIVFVSASEQYLDFLQNWYKSVAKFGYGSRVLFIAEDRGAYGYLKQRFPAQTVLVKLSDLNLAVPREGEGANSTYGSGHYNSLVDRRPEYFKALIDFNVTFLYNDVDIVWLRDPYPFFKGSYDMWVQEDAIEFEGSSERFKNGAPALPIRHKRHALCTCFMMVKPTRASRFLVHRWSRHVRTQVMHGGKAVLNQPAFNKALSLTPDKQVAIGVLPIMYFPSGYLFFRCGGQAYCKKNWKEREAFWKAVKEADSWPVMVHNNWLEGHDLKLKRFKNYRLWYLNESQGIS